MDSQAIGQRSPISGLADDVAALLAEIERGDILSAIEDRGANECSVADYLDQLGGLGFDEVVDLAGRPSEDPYFAALMRERSRSEGMCGESRERSEFLHSPYEYSTVEQILYVISYTEERYAEAREHLQNAIVAGGLNEEQVANAVRQIRDIDGKLVESSP
jgi:hypothetical protein